MKQPKFFTLFLIIIGSFETSCQNKFLDEKPNSNLIVPATLEDFQRLLDNYEDINASPTLSEASSDDYYMLSSAAWESLPTEFRNAYVWKPDLYEGRENISDWNRGYKQVFIANIVLQGMGKIERSGNNAKDWDRVKGWAHFIRGHACYNLAQLFAPVYDQATAEKDLGIPIRLQPGVDENSTRASLEETYQQILTDLLAASELLPEQLATPNRNRPSKPAAFGLLARVFLNMRDYGNAMKYAEACLGVYDVIMNFNDLNASAPFTLDNEETLFQSPMSVGQTLFQAVLSQNTIIDSVLFATYQDGDLRKELFIREAANGLPKIYRSYSGLIQAFGGVATDEIYLIEAEILARQNRIEDAMNILNKLLINRYTSGSFVPLSAGSSSQALDLVLLERRKELIFRGLRWQDLRRLNKEGFNISLNRSIGGQEYHLSPNSPLYVLPIPSDEIRLSNLIQNPR